MNRYSTKHCRRIGINRALSSNRLIAGVYSANRSYVPAVVAGNYSGLSKTGLIAFSDTKTDGALTGACPFIHRPKVKMIHGEIFGEDNTHPHRGADGYALREGAGVGTDVGPGALVSRCLGLRAL